MSRVAVLLLSVAASCQAGLLGAGHGEGSCAAAPLEPSAAPSMATVAPTPSGLEETSETATERATASPCPLTPLLLRPPPLLVETPPLLLLPLLPLMLLPQLLLMLPL